MPKTPDNIKDGTKLALFLRHVKLMQLTLANELGIPTPTMAHYVSGKSKTPQKVIDHLYKKYDLNLEWWYTGKGTKVKDAATPKGLVVDIGLIADKLEILNKRIDEQDRLIKKLTRDLYAKNEG